MRHRLSKNLKIIDEIVEYLYKKGCHKMNIDFAFEKDYTEFIIKIQQEGIPDKRINSLRERLNIQRFHEIEENFWELTGDSEIVGENELVLVGMMIDEAIVNYDGINLTVIVKRYEEEN